MSRVRQIAGVALACLILVSAAHSDQKQLRLDVRLHLALPAQDKNASPPAVVWLKPMQADVSLPFPSRQSYTLLQKNRAFIPHLLVVPVGSHVLFPNADPFYHNVFSLFDGKRFDLGLYEAGSTRSVTFSREGVSYIFCNIHPEMSAVVIALSTPLYATADRAGKFLIQNVPEGEYELHVWIEGIPQTDLDHLNRRVRVAPGKTDIGSLPISNLPVVRATGHLNKFGQPYDRDTNQPY